MRFNNTKTPKKDIGQSPLQVAIKCGEFEIIDFLLEKGADSDFMEDPSLVPPHSVCMSVLHDAIIGVFAALCYKQYNHSEKGGLLRLLSKVKDKQWVKPASTGSVVTALILIISLIFEIIGEMNIFRQYKVIIDYTQISVQQPDIIAGVIFMIAGFTLSTIVVGMRRYNIIVRYSLSV